MVQTLQLRRLVHERQPRHVLAREAAHLHRFRHEGASKLGCAAARRAEGRHGACRRVARVADVLWRKDVREASVRRADREAWSLGHCKHRCVKCSLYATGLEEEVMRGVGLGHERRDAAVDSALACVGA